MPKTASYYRSGSAHLIGSTTLSSSSKIQVLQFTSFSFIIKMDEILCFGKCFAKHIMLIFKIFIIFIVLQWPSL